MSKRERIYLCLAHMMLESMPVIRSSPYQFFSVKKMIGNADVEIVETRCLDQSPLHHLGVCWDAIA